MPRSSLRDHFLDHPGRANGDPNAIFGTGNTRDKVKVWCYECYQRRVQGIEDPEIIMKLWMDDAEGWISSHVDSLRSHLRRCKYQPQDVHDEAEARHHENLLRRRTRKPAMCRDVHRNAGQANAGGMTSSPMSPCDSVSEAASHVQTTGRLAPQLMPSAVVGTFECLANTGAPLGEGLAISGTLNALTSLSSPVYDAFRDDLRKSHGNSPDVQAYQLSQDALVSPYSCYDVFDAWNLWYDVDLPEFTSSLGSGLEGSLDGAFYDPHMASIF